MFFCLVEALIPGGIVVINTHVKNLEQINTFSSSRDESLQPSVLAGQPGRCEEG
ncbi:hypothetical protein Mhypo_00093 [Meiothermus hypogaeus]|uniref:Uncharacterized protein n=1 Tax=Meiothermus hypogaeus TaxID=884155 RepID=A0ABX9MU40_9DEIN|nr:hypothetical protein Mhypo_00093 [Meiothermus hypogaeus]